MALGGGNFTFQNKVVPGTYINFVSIPRPSGIFGERGYGSIALELDWGIDGITTVEPADLQKESLELFGYDYNAEEMKPIREILQYAKTAYIGRLNTGGEKATAEIEINIENPEDEKNTIPGKLKITAKCAGVRGNDIKIVIREDIDNEDYFNVKTYIGASLIDTQSVKYVQDLKDNSLVMFNFAGFGYFIPNAGTNLQGGTNGEVTGESHSEFLEELEKCYFNVVGYCGTDPTIGKLYESFVKRLRDDEGIKCQAVIYNRPANHEGVINLKAKAVEGDAKLVPWVVGASAGCAINRSLTNTVYNGEYTLKTDYKQRDIKNAIEQGYFIFHKVGDETRVLQDINSFTDFSLYKNKDFSYNQVIRVLDQIAMDTASIFNTRYLGKVQNNADGRIALWADLVYNAEAYQSLGAIQDFEGEHIVIDQGQEKNQVTADYKVKPVMAMEYLYMTVRVA